MRKHIPLIFFLFLTVFLIFFSFLKPSFTGNTLTIDSLSEVHQNQLVGETATGTFTLTLSQPFSSDTPLSLFLSNGSEIYSSNTTPLSSIPGISLNPGSHTLDLSVFGLRTSTTGNYFLTINTTDCNSQGNCPLKTLSFRGFNGVQLVPGESFNSTSFTMWDTLHCLVSASQFDDQDLQVSFYSPASSTVPYASFVKNQLYCLPENPFVCVASLLLSEEQLGNWSCAATLTFRDQQVTTFSSPLSMQSLFTPLLNNSNIYTSCIPDWQCTLSDCIQGVQTYSCDRDNNNCGYQLPSSLSRLCRLTQGPSLLSTQQSSSQQSTDLTEKQFSSSLLLYLIPLSTFLFLLVFFFLRLRHTPPPIHLSHTPQQQQLQKYVDEALLTHHRVPEEIVKELKQVGWSERTILQAINHATLKKTTKTSLFPLFFISFVLITLLFSLFFIFNPSPLTSYSFLSAVAQPSFIQPVEQESTIKSLLYTFQELIHRKRLFFFSVETPTTTNPLCPEYLYGKQIVFSPSSESRLQQAIREDFLPSLEAITNQEFTLFTPDALNPDCGITTGIFLLRPNSPLIHQAPRSLQTQLSSLQAGSYLIYSQGTSLWIIGTRDVDIEHGLYFYLEQLGMRWYLPSPTWTITPRRASIHMNFNTLRTPIFKELAWFGTGGPGPLSRLPTSDSNQPWNDWARWERRNQFPEDGIGCTHTFATFNLRNQAQIRADPLMLAEVGGTRLTLPTTCSGDTCPQKLDYTYHGQVNCTSPNALISYRDSSGRTYCEDKYDYTTYGGVIKLYGDWTLTRLQNSITQNPTGPESQVVSVEPSDRLDHDESKKSVDLLRNGPYKPNVDRNSSISDRVFHFANQIAKKVDETYPGKRVCLLAYNQHSTVPSIPLESNMLVLVVPHAWHFKYTGQTAESLLESWGDKALHNPDGTFNLGIYDYWGYTTRSHGLPTMPYQKAASRLRLWGSQNAENVRIETTAGSLGSGHLLYTAAKFAWNPQHDEIASLEEFYDLSFGPAKEPMKKLLTRWNKGVSLNSLELGLSYRDIQEAQRLAQLSGDESIQARIRDYALFLHYMRLRYEYDLQPIASSERSAADDLLLRHIWRLYHSNLVQSYALLEDLLDTETDPLLQAKWNLSNRNAPGWVSTSITPFSSQEINQWMNDGAQLYPALDLTVLNYEEDLTPLSSSSASTTSLTKGYITPTTFFFFTPGNRALPFTIVGSGFQPFQLQITNENEEVVYETTLPVTPTAQNFPLDLPPLPRGTYSMTLTTFGSSSRFWVRTPLSVPFVQVGTTRVLESSPSVRNYFYVPKGVEKFGVTLRRADSTFRFSLADNPTTPIDVTTLGNNIQIVNTHGNDGKIWSFTGYVLPQFINIPQVISYSPEQVMYYPLSS